MGKQRDKAMRVEIRQSSVSTTTGAAWINARLHKEDLKDVCPTCGRVPDKWTRTGYTVSYSPTLGRWAKSAEVVKAREDDEFVREEDDIIGQIMDAYGR
jgi:endogenous inhibitor of DNA gyrase (YacG/DUF329 family)